MKSAKKILALILAGVMALALLTGCGKATSLNRTVAEDLAEFAKSSLAQEGNKNNISVSYQVPELSREIAPLFDETWITKDNSSGKDALTEDAKQTLAGILSSYMSDSLVDFTVADVTDGKTPLMEVAKLLYSPIGFGGGSSNPADATSIRIAVVHKTVNGRTYALAVTILE